MVQEVGLAPVGFDGYLCHAVGHRIVAALGEDTLGIVCCVP